MSNQQTQLASLEAKSTIKFNSSSRRVIARKWLVLCTLGLFGYSGYIYVVQFCLGIINGESAWSKDTGCESNTTGCYFCELIALNRPVPQRVLPPVYTRALGLCKGIVFECLF